MKIFLLASLLLLLWAISCDKEKENEKSGLTIVSGYVCRGCSYEDSVIINGGRLNYRYMNSGNHHAYSRIQSLEKSEWDKLSGMIDLGDFYGIQLNSGNVYDEGSDRWVTIRNGSNSRTIRYGYRDSAMIQKLRPLIDKLDSLRSGFSISTETYEMPALAKTENYHSTISL